MEPFTRYVRSVVAVLIGGRTLVRALLGLAMSLGAAANLSAQTIEWVRQLGVGGDSSNGVGANRLGDVVMAGLTFGNLDGEHPGGTWDHFGDAFIAKTNSVGFYYGARQFGLGGRFQDITHGAAVDDLGNLFIAGSTEGGMNGSFAGGLTDGFIYKLNVFDGSTVGLRQIGTTGMDLATGVAVDGLGNGYAAGRVGGNLDGSPSTGSDAFVLQYAASGPGWTRQFGSPANDDGRGVSADRAGNVYVAGWTSGDVPGPNAGGQDAFLTKFDIAGQQAWSRQLGTSADDQAAGVSADALGSVFVTGYTHGDLSGPSAGGRDAFVSKYAASGDLLWTRQFGSPGDDEGTSIAADGLGNVFIAGHTSGSLSGANAGGRDAFVSMYAANGTRRWILQFGTSAEDQGLGVATDGLGSVYVTGRTNGNLSVLPAPYQGSGGGAFLVKIKHTPLPGDFNDDGAFDAADLAIWSANFGQAFSAMPGQGDAEYDADVDGADFLALQRLLDFGVSGQPPSVSTPEPASLELAIAMTLFAWRRNRSPRPR